MAIHSPHTISTPESSAHSAAPASRRAFTLVEIMIVVVIIGLLAAMAIPAFKRIHQTTQDKAVLNNARQIAAASNQYFLETGATTVDMNELVGYYKYIKTITPLAGEVYPTVFTTGIPVVVTNVGGGRTITFDM